MPSLSLWFMFIGTLVGAVLVVEGGYRWARRKENLEKEAPVGAMVGAVLGLLAFLLAVTFGFAADRYIARKRAVIDEANAIRITFIRTGLISEPHRSIVQRVLRQYVDERLHWAGLQMTHPTQTATELLNTLEAQAIAVGQENPSSEAAALFIESANQVEELHHERLMIRMRTRIPTVFWGVLYIVAFLGLGAMGYHCGVSGTVRSPVMVSVALAFAAVIVLIADLDLPVGALVTVNNQAMVDVRDSIAQPAPTHR
jgi:hypothetical protein